MGNNTSSARGHHEETVDFGSLYPQGVYTGPQDWNQAVVTQLIIQRRLAPFYRPLEDYDESWDDEQILAARKELPDPEHAHAESSSSKAESSSSKSHHKRQSAQKEISRYSEAALYRGAAECPICFLYYPANINHSRCCDQTICTECFVQIKRSEPTTTHMVSDPAACPYCVQENFGIVYTPPSWRAGIGSEGSTPPTWPDSPKGPQQSLESSLATTRRRRSFGPDSPEVVTIDQIRPDWEAKLAAVQAVAQRRANRRIIMRQVGDRLIPVGVTSGRIHALPADEAENAEGNGGSSRRSRRRQQNPDLQQILGQVGMGGQDLEEIMIMEAMRLSLIDHEDQQRRQREEELRNQRNGGGGPASGDGPAPASAQGPSSSPGASTLQPSNTAPSLTTQASEGGSSTSHRSSASLSTSPAGNMWHFRRPSPPPFSAISAAMNSAASTASAISTPHEDPPLPAATSNPSIPLDLPPILVEPTAEPVQTPGAESVASGPSLGRGDSSYDVLPSSPESAGSRLPLIAPDVSNHQSE